MGFYKVTYRFEIFYFCQLYNFRPKMALNGGHVGFLRNLGLYAVMPTADYMPTHNGHNLALSAYSPKTDKMSTGLLPGWFRVVMSQEST